MGRPRKASGQTAGSAKKIQVLEGCFDVISETDGLWDIVLKKVQRYSRVYGFQHFESPLIEDPELYKSFYRQDESALAKLLTIDMGGRPVALRPHLLPSVLRAYNQSKVFELSPVNKWAYRGQTSYKNLNGDIISDFEFGFEIFGSFNHLSEAQVVGAVWEMLQSLGLKDITLEINSIGQDECQVAYQSTLHGYLSAKKYELCDSCNDHLRGRVLNVFRCNNLDCQAVLSEAPTILDFLDQESHKHFMNILEALDELRIPYQLNPFHAGPDGYSQTNLVIKYKHKDQVYILGEGGYHSKLMESVTGKNWCCFGFWGSLLNIRKLVEMEKVNISREGKNDVYLVPLGELAAKKSLRLFRDLTTEKVSVYDHFGNAGVKNQLKQAQTSNAPIALIMGQKEAVDEMVILRDVKSGMQEIISYDKIVEEVKKRLGR